MVRTHNAPKQQLQEILNESDSESDQSYEPRGNSSQVSQLRKGTRNSSRLTSQNQSQASTSGQNQAGSSRGRGKQPTTTSVQQEKPKGAAKRKQKTYAKNNLPALQQIRYLQTHTENLIPKSPFCRVIKEILHRHGDFRMTKDSLDALQEAAEAYLVGVFGDAVRLTLHRGRVTIHPIDIQLLLYIRGGSDPGIPH